MSEAYTVFAAKYNYPSSERFKNVLRVLMDEDEVALANMLPGNSAELSQKLKKPQETVDRMLQGLYKKGVIFEFSGGYRPARDIMQLHDSTGSDVRSDKVWGRKLLDAWFDFSEKELFQIFQSWRRFSQNLCLVCPRKGIDSRTRKTYRRRRYRQDCGKIAQDRRGQLSCRRVAQRCERPVEVCLQVGKGADYAIKRGSGREVTKKEARDILHTAVEEAWCI